MNIARTVSFIRHPNISKSIVRKFRFSAANYESTQATQPQIKEEKFDFKEMKVLERTERRKEKIHPFMKDVFMSIFNRDLLAFPEILNKEESEALQKNVDILDSVFRDPGKTKDDRKDVLKRIGLYGGPVNLTDGGLAMNMTESIRYLETIGSDLELGQEISDHWVALHALKFGLHNDQFKKLIGDLISGEHTIGLCLKEKLAERVSQADFRTSAELDGHGVWRITGEKACYHQGGYYLVLCAVEARRLKAFLVHPKAEGVSTDGSFVTFMKTPGIILDKCTEQSIAQTLGLSRLHTATLCRQTLHKILKHTEEFVHQRVLTGKPLAEVSTIKSSVGHALLDLYASESAEYFTAGLLDGYIDPDAEVEVAMCRNFIAKRSLSSALDLLSIPALEMPKETALLLDELRDLVLRGEALPTTVDMFIALNGIHHAGKVLAEEIKQIRNPLFHPTFIIKKAIANRHQEKDDPKLNLYLAEHLHPSLKPPAEQLEYCVLRMKFACETMLSRHGVEVANALTELCRLADAATHILVMTAVLARASRSYCIGLRNGEVEMKLAACFVEQTKDHVRKLIKDIDDGEYLNLDHFRLQFGKKVLDSRSLVVEKPTARTFW